jgi:hypothetical protein
MGETPSDFSQICIKGIKGQMIQITKEEAMALRARFGEELGITITNRHKKNGRKRYYTEETNRVIYFLQRFRDKQLRKYKKSEPKISLAG